MNSLRKTVALIPARGGSKRIKNKNIIDVGGKPLLAWTIATCQVLQLKHYVSTDSRVIADMARVGGAEVIMRPPELASDEASDLAVVQHFTEMINIDEGDIVYLRPTTPFRTIHDVEAALKVWQGAGGEFSDSLRSIEEMSESAFKAFFMRSGYIKAAMAGNLDLAGLPQQQVEPTYKGNGAVDIVKAENVRKGILWGDRCIAHLTGPTIEIDTPFELQLARYWAATQEGTLCKTQIVDS